MADSAPSKAPPAARSRLDFLGPLLGILVVLVLATVVAAPRVPAVWSYHQMPDGIRNADGRPVVSEFSSARSQIYLPDPDDYTRLYRATKIAHGDVVTWKTMEEINAPVGVELHWTAPMDYLVADTGRFIKRIAGGANAFETSAAILPFALGLFHLLCLMGLVRQLSNWPVAVACGAPPFRLRFNAFLSWAISIITACLKCCSFNRPRGSRMEYSGLRSHNVPPQEHSP
ncbi:MAG: hypothetical protein IPK83_02325 [Planctomycetes bacterium]|nr:hypothetical protein [Planctomycetota bacterium]